MKLFYKTLIAIFLSFSTTIIKAQSELPYKFQSNGNPIITHKFTPDPAALVLGDTLWLFTGHDEAEKNQSFF